MSMFSLDCSQPIVGRKLTHVLANATRDPSSFMSDADRIDFLSTRDGREMLLKLAELKRIYRNAAIALKRRDEYQHNIELPNGDTSVKIVRPQKNNPYRKKYVQAAANHRQLERAYRVL
jgi:hypothetical protein